MQLPVELVRQTSEQVLTVLKEDKTLREDPERLHALVEEIILPRFDFKSMSRIVLGKHWRKATREQRQAFIHEFRLLLVRTYTTVLAEYSTETIRYLPLRGDTDSGLVTVRTHIERPGSLPVAVHYSMHHKDGAWTVYEVTMEGISLAVNYRTSFAQEIRLGGLDRLIDTLASRNQHAAR